MNAELPRDFQGNPVTPGLPIAMLAEITHRCPLACPYCSNPLDLVRAQSELAAGAWADVFRQAAALGVLQVHISGGEPASRRDLTQIAASAREAGLYVNLITSGLGLTLARLRELDAAGVDHVQLSLQGVGRDMADRIGGMTGAWDRKMQVAAWIGEVGFPLTLNAVVHRQNMDSLPQMIDLALAMGARRIEVATVQFHGWADLNRRALMPSREQAAFARRVVNEAREALRGRMVIDYVPADHHAQFPKACMGGWGSTGLNVTPDGTVLPCHAAQTIPQLSFENVRDRALADIWTNGAAFNAFRGTAWLPEPCASCDRKGLDFGGCRCQAMAIAGDAAATDPVCARSPLNAALHARAEAGAAPGGDELTYRRMGGADKKSLPTNKRLNGAPEI
ncbi:pyrroloquinoline quinone biosynthesis protein PqqE [Paracoccus sp. S-4012]|uniref:pyrroloquinoline quinone biosynthesis protein PqqE n=1 Tax=Paracoccus sp. S-4012 TaxID=2665648 RepID=UPI0012AF5FBD|nr:pyrroloquinoline quinone biosynthesis protein PqqE [Paracoccus sp. S-4012]MRX51684.1 pyrroloquinoline quinone biosynthesis protein PqqE [Paracoccus sp. S-4012]